MAGPAQELRNLMPEELEARLAERRREWMDLRFAREAGRLEHPHRIREIRREIARILTVLREREART